MSALEDSFHKAMVNLYWRAKEECGYTASYFSRMLTELGGIETAKTLVLKDKPTNGFTALWELGRLDLTVEALVLVPEFKSLFDEEVIHAARKRLEDYK
jgi:hypothetical protein